MLQKNRKLISSIKSIFLISSFFLTNAFATSAEICDDEIFELNRVLRVMLTKINIMPPVVQIYKPVRKLYEEAKDARDSGNYYLCTQKTGLALKHGRAYAK